MKRIIPLLILTLIIILPIEVKALSVSKNNLTIEKGKNETINLSATIEEEITEISFTLVYTTYDVPAYYNIATGLTDATPNSISHKITLSEPSSGTINLGTIKILVESDATDKAGTINIHSAKAITTEGETINLKSQTINVTIDTNSEEEDEEEQVTPSENKPTDEKEEEPKKDETKKDETNKTEDKQESTHLLEKIESNIVDIELKDGIYEYTVKIKEDIEELDLKPIVKDSKYKLEISNQKISELEDNQIIITVKNGEEKQEYIIKVVKINEIEIDNSEFESTYKYKSKWIILIIILSITLFVGLLLTKKNR